MGINTNQYGVVLFITNESGMTRHEQKGLPPMNLAQANKAAALANEKAPNGSHFCAYNLNSE